MIAAILTLPFLAFADSLSLKNFREIYESLQVSMNLAPKDTDESKKTFQLVFESLPATGAIGEYNASMQWALVKLTAEFCRERIHVDSQLPAVDRWLHRKIHFSKGPHSNESLTSILSDYSEVFWQRGPSPEETQILKEHLDSLLKELPDTPVATQTVLIATCTMVGISTSAITVY